MRKLSAVIILFLSLALAVSAAEISTADDLLSLMNGTLSWNGDYILTKDIDLCSCDGQTARF